MTFFDRSSFHTIDYHIDYMEIEVSGSSTKIYDVFILSNLTYWLLKSNSIIFENDILP